MKTRTPEHRIKLHLDDVIEMTNKFIFNTADITELGYDKNIIAVADSIYSQLLQENTFRLCVDFKFILSKQNLNSMNPQWLPTLRSITHEYEQPIQINSENFLNILTNLEPSIRAFKKTKDSEWYIECVNLKIKTLDLEFKKLVSFEQQSKSKAHLVLQKVLSPNLTLFDYGYKIFNFFSSLKSTSISLQENTNRKTTIFYLPKNTLHRISFFSSATNIVRLGCASKKLNAVINDDDIWKNQLSNTYHFSSAEIESIKQKNETYKDLFKRIKTQKSNLGLFSGLLSGPLISNSFQGYIKYQFSSKFHI